MGNGLTEQTCYNTRLQPTIRRLGTGTQSGCANASDKLHLTFDWGAAGSNNGNLRGQTIAAPGFSQTQYYEYDATNRLKIAVEGGACAGVADLPGDHKLVPRVQLRPLRPAGTVTWFWPSMFGLDQTAASKTR